MTRNRVLTFALLCLATLVVLGAMIWWIGGGYDDWERARVLNELVNSQAPRDEVLVRFGEPLDDYSVGSPDRHELEKWLAREHGDCATAVRERVDRYHGVFYHTTAWTMTWLVFDANGKLRASFRCAQ